MGGVLARAKAFTLGVSLLLGTTVSSADAAISWVKDLGTSGNSTAASTSLSVTLTAGAAAGNTVIVSFAMDPSGGAVACQDTQGNTYTLDAQATNGAATAGVRTALCSSFLATALVAGDSITVTHPAATARTMSASEFTGLAGPGVLDQ